MKMTHDEFRCAVGNRMRIIRRKKNIRQDVASKAIGICSATLSAYERGVSMPNCDVLVAIADYYRVTTDWLLKG